MSFTAIILDAIDFDSLYKFEMPYLQGLYEEHGDVLGCSTYPVTHSSNPLVWGGIENNDLHWLDPPEGAETPINPADFWEESDGSLAEGAEFFTRSDYDDSFIWDDLVAHGYDARALEIPIVIPPYSYNVEESLEDTWFPANEKQMRGHIRELTDLIEANLDADFLAVSIHVPDAWLHKIAEGMTTEEWVQKESNVLDQRLADIIEKADDWAIFGDHGSPQQGAMIDGDYILSRHRKESIIVSNLDAPVYTADLYPWFLDMFDAESVGEYVEAPDHQPEASDEAAERLRDLGYMG